MADHGANGKLVTSELPARKAFYIDQTGVRFMAAGTRICRPIPKRWNGSAWVVIPGP
jgi:hypothetical protein